MQRRVLKDAKKQQECPSKTECYAPPAVLNILTKLRELRVVNFIGDEVVQRGATAFVVLRRVRIE